MRINSLFDSITQHVKYYKWLYRFHTDPARKYIQQNAELKNVGRGKRAFLLATGPSIKCEDLRLLAGEDCFSLSNFFLHDDLQIINPLFHAFAPYHDPMILENYVAWLRQSDSTLPPSTNIILGHSTRSIVEDNKLFESRKVYYLYLASAAPPKQVNIVGPVLSPQTGPLMLLPLLIYMGYEKIYLLGCDHTVLRDYKKNIVNFYNAERDLRSNATSDWHDIEKSINYTLNIFEQYKYFKHILICEGKNRDIINLSQDSWLEVFEFMRLKDITK